MITRNTKKLSSNTADINVANNFIEFTPTPNVDVSVLASILAKENISKDVIVGIGWLMARYRYMRGNSHQKRFLQNFITEFNKVRKK
jgi:hypothetical protein